MGWCYTKDARALFGKRKDNTRLPLPAGHEKCAYLGEFYWYDEGSANNPAFGLRDLQFAIEQEHNAIKFSMSCQNDGEQGGSGASNTLPLKVILLAGDVHEVVVEKIPYQVRCHDTSIAPTFVAHVKSNNFKKIDGMLLPGGARTGFAQAC